MSSPRPPFPAPGFHEIPERRRTTPEKRAYRSMLLGELRTDLAARLRRVCAHMPEAEFERLVLDMARMRMRFWDLEQDARLQVHYEPEE